MSYLSTLGVLPVELASFGTRIGYGYLTKVTRTPSGREYRDRLRPLELGRWVVRVDSRKRAQFDEFTTFFRAAYGMAYSFRALDPLDYSATSSEGTFLATADAGIWQMVKKYTTAGGAIGYRKVTKLNSATPSSGVRDVNTGLVNTGGAAPSSWSGTYWMHVRFDVDELLPRIVDREGNGNHIVAIDEVPLVEVDE